MPAEPLTIIAGAGRLPLDVAAEVRGQGRDVHVVGLAGAADPAIEQFSHIWMKFGELGKLYRQLDAWGCRDMLILGAVNRPGVADIKFDLGAVSSIPDIARLLRKGDDGVLDGVVTFLEGRGYRVHGVLEIAPGLAAGQGAQGASPCRDGHREDIAFGCGLLAAIAPFDVGQAVVVVDGHAVAVEGLEGTDRMLERVAALRAEGRLKAAGRAGVLVKAPKRTQNMKVDVPAIGPRTVEMAIKAQLEGIAVAAGQVIVADRTATLAEADAAGLFVFGFNPDGAAAWGR